MKVELIIMKQTLTAGQKKEKGVREVAQEKEGNV